MNLKKTTVIILCAAMAAAALAGCKKEPDEALPDDTYIMEDPLAPADDAWAAEYENGRYYSIDYDAAFAAFAPDAVMINAGGYNVTWAELFFHLYSNIYGMQQSFGDINDWDELMYTGTSYADTVLAYASDNALLYKAVEYGAGLSGTSLSAEDMELLDEQFESTAEELGGEEEYLRLLWEMDGISSRELFDYLIKTSLLVDAIITEMYGENAENVTDDDAAEYTQYDGYMMAKHILRLKPDEGEDTARAEAEEILEMLESYTGDDFATFFEGIMWENTDDIEGAMLFPDGYLFQYGDMVPEFYDVCSELEIGEHSGIVEVSYGYHIIHRLPIDFDTIPTGSYMQNDQTTLRQLVALALFDSVLYGWKDDLAPGYTTEYDSINIAAIFGIVEHEVR